MEFVFDGVVIHSCIDLFRANSLCRLGFLLLFTVVAEQDKGKRFSSLLDRHHIRIFGRGVSLT
jgi:hypothetical protein